MRPGVPTLVLTVSWPVLNCCPTLPASPSIPPAYLCGVSAPPSRLRQSLICLLSPYICVCNMYTFVFTPLGSHMCACTFGGWSSTLCIFLDDSPFHTLREGLLLRCAVLKPASVACFGHSLFHSVFMWVQ